jgi:hypothetical protein
MPLRLSRCNNCNCARWVGGSGGVNICSGVGSAGLLGPASGKGIVMQALRICRQMCAQHQGLSAVYGLCSQLSETALGRHNILLLLHGSGLA